MTTKLTMVMPMQNMVTINQLSKIGRPILPIIGFAISIKKKFIPNKIRVLLPINVMPLMLGRLMASKMTKREPVIDVMGNNKRLP